MCLPLLAPLGAMIMGGGATAATAGAAAMGTMAAASMASGVLSAYSSIQQGKAAAAAGKFNSKMANYAAEDAIRRGEEEAAAVSRKAAGLKSAQRVGLAGHGVDVGYGTAQDLQDQTDFFGQWDAATTRHNARTEAWSDRAQGLMAKAEGQNAKQQGYLNAAGSLLGSASKVAGQWYSFRT